jgi:aryl-alcohol dehydrogenase-like predicted oxidoreductase
VFREIVSMKASPAEPDAGRRRLLMALGALAAWPVLGGTSAGDSSGAVLRAIPGSGEQLPVVGLDTAKGFDPGKGKVERAVLAEILGRLARIPNSLVDTSPMYGGAESLVGTLSPGEGGLFLATKVWTHGRGEGVLQLQRSERNLGAGRLDLVQVHNLVDWRNQLRNLKEWKEQGRLRYIGVTHYHRAAFGAMEGIMREQGVDFIQINYSLAEPEAELDILPLARELGVAVIANRPFSGGYLFRKLEGRPLPGWAAEIGCVSWAQLLLKYVISNPAITCAIPGADSIEQLTDNLAAGQGPLPDRRTRARMRALMESV